MADSNNQPQKIVFDLSFIELAESYLKKSKKPSVADFAKTIGTDENSVISWASKLKKDADGNVTDQLARPKFHAIIESIKNFKQVKQVIEKIVEEIKEEELNERQEKFCQLYATDREFFGNGVDSYLEVYDVDKSKSGWYNTACAAASRLLRNVKVFERINNILETEGLNDAFVDKQLKFLITQHASFDSKLGAIREYNKLKSRITEKMDLSSKGEKLASVVGFTVLAPGEQIDDPSASNNQTNL